MRVIVLVENTSISKDYKSKHGLCLYIETKKHKLLFDLGSNSLFSLIPQHYSLTLFISA